MYMETSPLGRFLFWLAVGGVLFALYNFVTGSALHGAIALVIAVGLWFAGCALDISKASSGQIYSARLHGPSSISSRIENVLETMGYPPAEARALAADQAVIEHVSTEVRKDAQRAESQGQRADADLAVKRALTELLNRSS